MKMKALAGRSGDVSAIFLVMLLIVCVLGGGASRLDALSQTPVWIASIMCGAVALLSITRDEIHGVRTPLLFVIVAAVLVILQLVPLPPALWSALPGRALYVQATNLAGVALPWRPISLTPDLTLASLLSLLPPAALILAYARLNQQRRRLLPFVVLGIVMFSALLGLAQLGGGATSPFRFYAVTNEGMAVGIFANRNHQALLLVMGLPLLAACVRLMPDARLATMRDWLAVAAAIFLVPLILLTGSRSGIVLGVLALIFAALLARTRLEASFVPRRYQASPWMRYLPIAGIVVAILLSVLLSRAVSIDRLLATDAVDEERLRLLGPLWEMAKHFMPFGTGFGSFESTYPSYEPFELLSPNYMNQAHNDLIQLAIEGGLPGLALFTCFLVWLVRRAILHWRPKKAMTRDRLLGRLGVVLGILILVASLPDYPLRTPLVAILLTMAALWMAAEPDLTPNSARVRRADN